MARKLSENQVLAIFHSQLSNKELAKVFDVYVSTIYKIKMRETWREVTTPFSSKQKTGRPHQSKKSNKKAWCPINGCGKKVVGKYFGAFYFYECEVCKTKFDKKPDW